MQRKDKVKNKNGIDITSSIRVKLDKYGRYKNKNKGGSNSIM